LGRAEAEALARLATLVSDLLGLEISEGALVNILEAARARADRRISTLERVGTYRTDRALPILLRGDLAPGPVIC